MTQKEVSSPAVDEYIAKFPPQTQSILQKMRKTVREAAPDAKEVISYKMPGYILNGTVVWFAAFEDHISFFPKISPFQKFRKELSPYASGRATVKFPLDEPIPYDLVKRIVKFRVQENLVKKKATGTRKKTS